MKIFRVEVDKSKDNANKEINKYLEKVRKDVLKRYKGKQVIIPSLEDKSARIQRAIKILEVRFNVSMTYGNEIQVKNISFLVKLPSGGQTWVDEHSIEVIVE
jgi:hypothetical protein